MPKEKDTVKSIELAYERSHALSVERYAKRIDDIYNTYTLEYTKMAGSILNIDVSKPFTFSDYPQTNDRINNLLKEQFNAVKTTITKGVDDEWIRSCLKNDKIVKKVLSRKKLTEDHYKRYYKKYNSRNEDSLKAFKLRKDKGLDLSKRVWKHTASFKGEIEAAIDAAISSGQTAIGLAAEVKKYLDQPDKLFRRVKGPDGRLRLSKPAQAYKPGQGVYRSSHKNAMRLARTEINMSYRTSDHIRYQQLDFIVGIRISLSNNPRHCPVCQELAGDYPKSFKFVGWHPMCRCFTTTILKTPDELDKDEDQILKGEPPSVGSKNNITSPPGNFISWINDNKDRIANAKSVPYWVKDNFKDGLLANGLNVVAPVSTKPIKTDQQKADIQARWNSRVAGRKHGGHLTDLRAKYGKGSDTIAKMEIQIRNQISKGIGLTDIDKMVDMLNHKVQVKIAWDERLLVNANKVSSKLDEVILTLDKSKGRL